MGKIRITGYDEDYCRSTYGKEDSKPEVGVVHVMSPIGSCETTLCTIDVVHGIQIYFTDAPVDCPQCRAIVKYIKDVKLGRG